MVVEQDYGDNDNRIYLEHHGFVPHHNPHNCIRVSLPAIDRHWDPHHWLVHARTPPHQTTTSSLAPRPLPDHLSASLLAGLLAWWWCVLQAAEAARAAGAAAVWRVGVLARPPRLHHPARSPRWVGRQAGPSVGPSLRPDNNDHSSSSFHTIRAEKGHSLSRSSTD